MEIKDLYKEDLKIVPFGSCIDQSELFTEYEKVPLIPDLNLFLQMRFQGQTIDESFDYTKLDKVSVEFYKTKPSDIPNDCKKPDIKQTETFKNLEKIDEAYTTFLKNISTNEIDYLSGDVVLDQLTNLSPKNQLSIINYMISDKSLGAQLLTGEIILNPDEKRPVPSIDGSKVYDPKFLPYEIVKQRIESFKENLVRYKNSLSDPVIKEKKEKPVKNFEDYVLPYQNTKGDRLLKELKQMASKNQRLEIATRIFNVEKEGVITIGKKDLKPFIQSFWFETIELKDYNYILNNYNILKNK